MPTKDNYTQKKHLPKSIFVIGILLNLAFGNLLLLAVDRESYLPQIAFSGVAISWYIYFFSYTNYEKKSALKLLLFSLLSSSIIMILGIVLMFVLFALKDGDGIGSVLKSFFVGAIFGLIINAAAFYLTVITGVLNWIWFLLMKRSANNI